MVLRRLSANDPALHNASVQHVHHKQSIFPDGECGYRKAILKSHVEMFLNTDLTKTAQQTTAP